MVVEKKTYDLEDRTWKFARDVRVFVKNLPKHVSNFEDIKQVVRSSGSVGANYIEANESLGKGDFLMRVRISRKEAKETVFWLRLIDVGTSPEQEAERRRLANEADQLMRIFGAILQKSII